MTAVRDLIAMKVATPGMELTPTGSVAMIADIDAANQIAYGATWGETLQRVADIRDQLTEEASALTNTANAEQLKIEQVHYEEVKAADQKMATAMEPVRQTQISAANMFGKAAGMSALLRRLTVKKPVA